MLLSACSGSSDPEPERAPESEPGARQAEASPSAPEAAPGAPASEPVPGAPDSEASAREAEEVEPEPDTLRFVVVHDGPELLGSEERQLGELRAGLASGREVSADETIDAERAWVTDGGDALPEPWSRFETVVAVRVAEPRTLRNGRRMSQGLRSVHVLRPPRSEPVYALEGEGPVDLAPEKDLAWLDALLEALDEGESE